MSYTLRILFIELCSPGPLAHALSVTASKAKLARQTRPPTQRQAQADVYRQLARGIRRPPGGAPFARRARRRIAISHAKRPCRQRMVARPRSRTTTFRSKARERKKIFRRFYQVDRRLTRDTGGCGLGLSIVDFIVRAHGGAVEVKSQPGRGSTFSVAIPEAA